MKYEGGTVYKLNGIESYYNEFGIDQRNVWINKGHMRRLNTNYGFDIDNNIRVSAYIKSFVNEYDGYSNRRSGIRILISSSIEMIPIND